MMSTSTDPVVHAYLERLRVASARLAPEERADVWAAVTEHLDAARAAGEPAGSALARLGSPEEIVAAYAGEDASRPGADVPATAAPGAPAPRLTWRDTLALVLLQLGGLAFGIGWVVGVALLWVSDRWKWWEKLLGTLVVPGGLAGLASIAFLAAGVATETSGACPATPLDGSGPAQPTCSETTVTGGHLAGLLLPLLFLAAISVTVYLAVRARPGRSTARRGQTV